MPYADINGQRIHFQDSGGPGSPVVFTHGFLMDQSMFDRQVEALAPEFRVIRMDSRTFGETQWDGKPFTLWDTAADIIGLLDHLKIEQAVLGGMSQGGFASLRAALAHPRRVKALVLLSTSGHSDDDEQTKAARAQLAEIWGPNQELLEQLAGMILGGKEHWEPWITKWKGISRERVQGAMPALLNRDDIFPRLGEITCPALVVHGTDDVGIPLEKGEALAKALPRCKRFVKVEGAAHAANLTHHEQVNPPLLEFLRAFG
ncbi:MAG: alpha/beta hydrolase [Polyangiaceae bacterium]|nr:alpha/beta hydrolase [Polyangiaceae bacterium]